MKLTVIETNFKLDKIDERMLILLPIKDMHVIEEWEARFDRIGVKYALIECRKKTKHQDIFMGYSLITDYTEADN